MSESEDKHGGGESHVTTLAELDRRLSVVESHQSTRRRVARLESALLELEDRVEDIDIGLGFAFLLIALVGAAAYARSHG